MKKPKFKRGQFLREPICGCRYKVLGVGKKDYTVFHLGDGPKYSFRWDIRDTEKWCVREQV